MDDDHIGARLRRWRQRRGLTQRVLADRAGFSQGYVAQIEKGMARLDRIAAQEAFAQALQICVGELTGRLAEAAASYRPVDPDAIAALRSGIIALSCPEVSDSGSNDPHRAAQSWDVLVLDRYFDACRYDVLVPELGRALTDLAVGSRAATGPLLRQYQRQVVEVCSTTVSTCIQLGHGDLALIVADLAMRTARELAEPAILGVANYARVRAVSTEAGAARLAEEGIRLLEAHVGNDAEAASTYGMHHLISAELAAQAGRNAAALDHLHEAARVAGHVGENSTKWFAFGPTNVGIWRVAILVALGDGPAARTSLPGFRLDNLPSAHRQATYFIDLARGLLQGRGMDSAAVAALYRAEAIAPQQLCVAEGARTALRVLLSRPMFGRDNRLRGLAHRAGVHA